MALGSVLGHVYQQLQQCGGVRVCQLGRGTGGIWAVAFLCTLALRWWHGGGGVLARVGLTVSVFALSMASVATEVSIIGYRASDLCASINASNGGMARSLHVSSGYGVMGLWRWAGRWQGGLTLSAVGGEVCMHTWDSRDGEARSTSMFMPSNQ